MPVNPQWPQPESGERSSERPRRIRAAIIGGVVVALIVAVAAVATALSRHTPRAHVTGSAGSTSPIVAIQPGLSGSPSATGTPSRSASPTPSASKKKATAAPTQAKPVTGSTIPNRPNCGPVPSNCGMPDATNTGVPPGTNLTRVDGVITITKAGTVISNKDIHGCVVVNAAHVTIKNTKISCTDTYGINLDDRVPGGGLLIEDVEVDCENTNTTGVTSYGLTAIRLNVHGCENGFSLDSTSTVKDTYIHDLYEGQNGHADGIQLLGGSEITITHNTIYNKIGTSAIISDLISQTNDVLIQSNLVAGGAYTVYCPTDDSKNFRVINNRFSTIYYPDSGEYGPFSSCDRPTQTTTGNLWDTTLKPVPLG